MASLSSLTRDLHVYEDEIYRTMFVEYPNRQGKNKLSIIIMDNFKAAIWRT